MTKISITIILNEDSSICISNSNGISITIKTDEGTIKASDVFKLFDNGIDVAYGCDEKMKVSENGQNLTKGQLMFNDCLELIQNVIDSVNQKIVLFKESQKEGEEQNENNK